MKLFSAACFAIVLSAAGFTAPSCLAQAAEPDVATVDDIVITARRADAPMWTVERGDSTIILVGSIRGLPRDFAWRPEALEQAAGRADRILYPPAARVSAGDFARLIWRSRTIFRLPNGSKSSDHLAPEVQTRLDAVMAGEKNQDWRRRSFLILSDELLERAGLKRGGRDAQDVVRSAARKAHVEGQTVGFVRGDEIIDSLITQPPSTYAPCMVASIAAAEAGPGTFAERAEDWKALRVPEVMANPLDAALGQCWPWADPEIGPQLRSQWLTALSTALAEPGVSLAVAPLRLLAEPGGVLDGLEAEGLDVVGPPWKPEETPQ